MSKIFNTDASKLVGLFLILSIFLSGCAYAPGQSMGDFKSTSAARNTWPMTTKSQSAADDGVDAASIAVPIPFAPISITPTLIRQQRAEQSQISKADLDHIRSFGKSKPYEIGFGDVLNITVWGHPELVSLATGGGVDGTGVVAVASGYNVNADGLIQYPHIGSIKLSGMTEIAARDAISKSLSKYIKSPDISLRVQAFRSGRVYVEGEVRAPGVQAINDVPLSLSELLGRAGGLTALADRSSVFVTRDNTSTRINLVDLEQQKIEINSIFLSDKDTVRIASREDSKVYVLGEVTRPVTLLMRNTRMSLGEALGEAGGVNQLTGDPRNIYVLRSDADAKPYIFHLDASTPTNYLLANGFELLPRDLVFVDPTNLVRFNRVISLFLPSTQGVNSGVDLSRK